MPPQIIANTTKQMKEENPSYLEQDNTTLEYWETELWQLLRYNPTLSCNIGFNLFYGCMYWLFITDREKNTLVETHGENLWKRMKYATNKLHRLGYGENIPNPKK